MVAIIVATGNMYFRGFLSNFPAGSGTAVTLGTVFIVLAALTTLSYLQCVFTDAGTPDKRWPICQNETLVTGLPFADTKGEGSEMQQPSASSDSDAASILPARRKFCRTCKVWRPPRTQQTCVGRN